MVFNSLLNLLFPPSCLACRASLEGTSEALCPPCASAIEIEQTLRCGECFARIPEQEKICHKDFPYILGAATRYHDARVRALVQGLKFRHAHAAAAALAGLLARYLRGIPLQLDSFAIVPVPLSPLRERKRGFNQATLIAASLAPALGIPIISKALVRTSHSKPQSELKNWDERRTNVANAFAVLTPDRVAKQNIILLDDVTTSGATFFETATALKHAGARRILALAAARA